MTVDALRAFGSEIYYDEKAQTFEIRGKKRLHSPESLKVGGDWSNAAFFITSGVIGKKAITVDGLDVNSRQGDKRIIEVLRHMGANIVCDGDSVTALPSKLSAARIDAADIPDLVPILATAASVADGETVIFNASRLRLKESDRIESVRSILSTLGASISATDDGLIIRGKNNLLGGTVDSFNDHRIAMSAAVASLVCENAVTVTNFEAINKSYPSFADNWE
jgi:3-phosphoshikimate 1-carboxyvinyltransferase